MWVFFQCIVVASKTFSRVIVWVDKGSLTKSRAQRQRDGTDVRFRIARLRSIQTDYQIVLKMGYRRNEMRRPSACVNVPTVEYRTLFRHP